MKAKKMLGRLAGCIIWIKHIDFQKNRMVGLPCENQKRKKNTHTHMKKSHWWFFLRCCPNENHGRKTCLGLDFFISLVALGLVWTSQSSILEVVATSLVMKQCSNVLSLKCYFFKINHKILPKQNSALAEIWSRIRITSFIWHLFFTGMYHN